MAAYNSAETGENNDYTDTNDKCAGLIFHKDAAGVVETVSPTVETTSESFRVQYQGDLIVGKLSMGVGQLRTSVAGSLQAK